MSWSRIQWPHFRAAKPTSPPCGSKFLTVLEFLSMLGAGTHSLTLAIAVNKSAQSEVSSWHQVTE